MQNRHMRGNHPHGFHILIKIMFIFLIMGALFSSRGHHRQSAYWEGFRAGAAMVTQGGDSAAQGQIVPPFAPYAGMDHGFHGPGFPALLFLPLCGLALFGFMGFLFVISRGARHRKGYGGSWGRGGPWGRGGSCGPWGDAPGKGGGHWSQDDTTMGRAVDDDDEIGPEKQPEDIL